MVRVKHSTSKVITLVLAIAFGIVALAMTYDVATRSTEQRSRAVEASELVVKQWEFNGTTTEGWGMTGFSNMRVISGILSAVNGKSIPSAYIYNRETTAINLQGAKYIKLRLGIGRTSSPEPKGSGPEVYRATGTVIYTLLDRRSLLTRPLTFLISADGTLREYSLILPEIAPVTINSIKISFTGLRPGSKLNIDWIRLGGTKPRPTPLPTLTCKTGVNNFSVDTACDGGYRYMTFRCYDGYGRREGGPTSCKSSDVWASYAKEYCTGRSNCPTPSTTLITTPSTSCGPVACEVPSPGCSYQGGTSCSCGILVCSVQVVTSTPTPSFKPL